MSDTKISALTSYSNPDAANDVIPIGQRRIEHICKVCKITYVRHISRKSLYCSQRCFREYQKVNPKGVLKQCVTCGQDFRVSAIIVDVRVNCSKVCNATWQSKQKKGLACFPNRKIAKGSQVWNWVGGRPKCKRCDKTLGNYHPVTYLCSECRYENSKYKGGSQHKAWALSVKLRDNFTCQVCGIRGGNLESDHIKPWSLYPELRFDLDNGRTLCKDCHMKTPTYAGRANKFKELVNV